MAILEGVSDGGSGEGAPAGGNGGGEGAPAGGGFLDTLPEDLRGDASLKDFKDVGGLAKSYVETKKMIGDAALLKPPKDPAQKAEWIKNTRPKLVEMGLLEGAPEKADGYEFKFDGVTPEEVQGDPGLGAFREVAHELGLSQAQAQKLALAYREKIFPAMAPKMPTEEEARAELSKDFGDKFNQKLDVAKRAVNTLNGQIPGFKDWLEDPARGFLGNDPMYIRIMAAVGEMMGQDFAGGVGERMPGETLESIDDKIRTVRNDKTLIGDQVAEKLLPLYKTKNEILKRNMAKR